MKTGVLELLQVTQDGIDLVLGQQDHLRRWKLQMLDLQTMHQNF
jgi:hypothetical protein